MCGDTGFPGEDDIDIEVPATIGGTLESCRLEELDERFKSMEDDIDSVSALCDSRMD